jgi:hypothetical protein
MPRICTFTLPRQAAMRLGLTVPDRVIECRIC